MFVGSACRPLFSEKVLRTQGDWQGLSLLAVQASMLVPKKKRQRVKHRCTEIIYRKSDHDLCKTISKAAPSDIPIAKPVKGV